MHDTERLVRAVAQPYPGAFYFDANGRKIIVWSAELSDTRPTKDYIEFEDGFLAILFAEQLPK